VKIAAGLQAIEDRRAQLSGDHNTRDERIALDDALQTLQILSRYLAA
jgi:hypothetical protein